jgi:hypothetical protein
MNYVFDSRKRARNEPAQDAGNYGFSRRVVGTRERGRPWSDGGRASYGTNIGSA